MNTNEIDRLSLEKARTLFDSGQINRIKTGTVKGLCDIHAVLIKVCLSFGHQIGGNIIFSAGRQNAGGRNGNVNAREVAQFLLVKQIIGAALFLCKIGADHIFAALFRILHRAVYI